MYVIDTSICGTIRHQYRIQESSSPSIITINWHNLCMNDVSRHFININQFIYSPTLHVLIHDITNSPSILNTHISIFIHIHLNIFITIHHQYHYTYSTSIWKASSFILSYHIHSHTFIHTHNWDQFNSSSSITQPSYRNIIIIYVSL